MEMKHLLMVGMKLMDGTCISQKAATICHLSQMSTCDGEFWRDFFMDCDDTLSNLEMYSLKSC